MERGGRLVRKGAWVKRLLLCSGLAVVVYLVALSSGSGWLYVLAAAVMGTSVLSLVAPAVSLAGIRADATGIEALVQEGSDIPALIELENRSRLPRYVLECRLRLAGGGGGGVMGRLGGLGFRSVSLSRPRTSSLEVDIRRVRRGVYERGNVEVGSGIPFGLFHVLRRFPVSANVTVYPELVDARGLLDALEAASAVSNRVSDAGHEARRKEPGMGEMRGLREYRAGDSARLVSWRASARALASGERPRVVELEEETGTRPLSIRVDLGEGADPEEAESTLSTAASLLVAAIERGRLVYGVSPGNAALEGSRDPAVVLAWCAALEPPGNMASASLRDETSDRCSGKPGYDSSPDVSLSPRSSRTASPLAPGISLEVVGARPSRAREESGVVDESTVARGPVYGQPQPPREETSRGLPRAFYPASGRIQRS